jgi:RNA polymerase sigma factor (sigma-70 family)
MNNLADEYQIFTIANGDSQTKIKIELRSKATHCSWFNPRSDMSDNDNISQARSDADKFATTHWSVVLAAGDTSSPQHEQALSTLCQSYWYPLYAYLRRCGYDIHQAEDNTQAFFAQMLEKHYLRKVKPKPGRFRSFLLTAIKHFLANDYDRTQALKRGGGRRLLSLDFRNAENQYILEPSHQVSAEKLYEKSWAITVLERTMDRLETELASENKQKLFDCLKVYLGAEAGSIPYHDVASELGVTEGAVRVSVHRLRERFRELLREEIAQTVTTSGEIDEELHSLFSALSS